MKFLMGLRTKNFAWVPSKSTCCHTLRKGYNWIHNSYLHISWSISVKFGVADLTSNAVRFLASGSFCCLIFGKFLIICLSARVSVNVSTQNASLFTINDLTVRLSTCSTIIDSSYIQSWILPFAAKWWRTEKGVICGRRVSDIESVSEVNAERRH